MASKSNWTTPCLIAVIAIQWIFITVLLQQRHHDHSKKHDGDAVLPPLLPPRRETQLDMLNKNNNINEKSSIGVIEDGVFATVIFRAPKWFHLRYLGMIHNALANLPALDGSWKVQIFVNQQWVQQSNLLEWHPGMQRYFQGQHPRVVVTPLPLNLTNGKPKEVLFTKWFWESMLADRIVLFSGNGAFCGNQPSLSHNKNNWKELLQLDYCGVPSHRYHGTGGDGLSHSIRNRQAMLRVIEYAQRGGNKPDLLLQDEKNFLDIMVRINKDRVQNSDKTNNTPAFRLATPEQPIQFGGVYNLSDANGLVRLPLAVAGTQAKLTYAERDSLLKHCPELKTIFPSLHEPACFGAKPNAEQCKATICALQDDRPSGEC